MVLIKEVDKVAAEALDNKEISIKALNKMKLLEGSLMKLRESGRTFGCPLLCHSTI